MKSDKSNLTVPIAKHGNQTSSTSFNNHELFSTQNIDNTSLNLNFNGSLEQAANYYCKQANKLYFANVVLNNQLKSVIEEKNNIAMKLAKLEKQMNQNSLDDDKKKRHRRTANQIQRAFKCPVNNCQKSYGSQGSLSQHLKIKHFEFYKAHINSDVQLDSKIRDKSNQEQKQKKDKDDSGI